MVSLLGAGHFDGLFKTYIEEHTCSWFQLNEPTQSLRQLYVSSGYINYPLFIFDCYNGLTRHGIPPYQTIAPIVQPHIKEAFIG